MSTSTLYAVYRTKATVVKEFQNGWGSAPVIWGYLNKRYCGGEPTMPVFGDMSKVWNLWCDPKVPESLRACNAFTLDHVIVAPKDAKRMASNLKKAHTEVTEADFTWSHFSDIADALLADAPDYRMEGYGLSCTSVSDPWADWRGGKDPEAWDLFAEMDQIIAKAKEAA